MQHHHNYQNNTPKQNLRQQQLYHSFKGGVQQHNIVLGTRQQQQQSLELNPSTPQRFNTLKVLNMPGQQQDNSFRSSSQKKLLTCESPQLSQQNKENGYISARNGNDPNVRIQNLALENKKLNDFISRQFKEKQDMLSVIDRLKSNNTIDGSVDQSFDFAALQDRVERLEKVIDMQSEQIVEWKNKYKEACEQDDRVSAVEQMEAQIMQVVEENERLNNISQEKEQELLDINNKYDELLIKYAECEINNKQLNDKIHTLQINQEEYQHKLMIEEQEKLEMQQQLIELNAQFDEINIQVVNQQDSLKQSQISVQQQPKEAYHMLEQLQTLEKQLSDLSTQYTFVVLDNQKLQRQNQLMKDELSVQQKAIDEIRGSSKGQAVHPKVQEINKMVKSLREQIMKQIGQ